MHTLHFVDIETTHLDPRIGEIIEIAILTSIDGGRTISSTYHTKIRPGYIQDADPKSLEINGYTPDEWTAAPVWSTVAPKIAEILSTGLFVAHNVRFDHAYLEYWIKKTLSVQIIYRTICTQSLVWTHLETKSASMKNIRDRFGWSHDGAHTAIVDARDCHRLYTSLVHLPIFPSPTDIESVLDRVSRLRSANISVIGIPLDEMERICREILVYRATV